jgi:hypothetical protein
MGTAALTSKTRSLFALGSAMALHAFRATATSTGWAVGFPGIAREVGFSFASWYL